MWALLTENIEIGSFVSIKFDVYLIHGKQHLLRYMR